MPMDSALQPVDVVINPAARGGRVKRKVALCRQALVAAGFSPTVHAGTDPDSTRSILEDLVAQRRERVIVVGGDGMVHLAANALVGSTTALGIIAAGSGNDAARALGLPRRGPQAVRAALGDPVAVDVLVAKNPADEGVSSGAIRDGLVAVTVATAGFPGDVNHRANEMSPRVRPASYLLSTLAEFPRLRHRRLRLDIDGQRWEIDCALLAIANTAFFGGGMKIAPGAEPFDGSFTIVVGMGSSRVRYARLLPQVFSGGHIGDSYVLELTGKKVTITALDGEPLRLWADGEPWVWTPVTVDCRPEALLVAGVGSNR